LIGATVSHYQILEHLGGGGMGVVYKARDLKLGRLVALKFLSGQRGSPEERRRFLREAQAASRLDHPNICTIHEIEETEDGGLFIAMGLCEGETLRERLSHGPLPVAEAIDVAVQVAAGLSQAHERGIIHRDVKPANIAFTNGALTAGGQVKLLDFGIARLADQSRLTLAGTAVGTAAYMAPEQFRGAPAEPRSDVWSLGVVLYQMVAGRHPFENPSAHETVRAILEREPPPLSQLRPDLPEGLERIVARALSKHPSGRYESMAAMAADLRALAVPASPVDRDSDLTLELQTPRQFLLRTEPLAVGETLLGRTIGPYRVTELLGSGGMGVVYKAEDSRLSRTVALKFLSPGLTRDPAAKARFIQEARAASSLDHPNLCTILDLGETGDGQLYIAMPCYDGETLRGRIGRGPLPVEEALDIALQTARGLAKAHRSGIIHRDVKPANLIVTSDGVVKILDFGLAKLAGAALTRTRSVAGTPAYMSPEQAQEEGVDHRTDLWSLGVVLYEMVAGRRPFRGEGGAAVVHAILNERPRPLREVRPGVPAELERIVDRLLAKDPADRYPAIEAPLAGIRALLDESTTRSLSPRQGGRPWLWGTLAGVAILAVLLGYLLRNVGAPGAGQPVRTSFVKLTDQPGPEMFPSLAPDGEYFAYSRESSPGNEDVYLQRTGGSNAINLTADSPAGDTQPAFSPDGRTIAFRSERGGGGIFLMGATGESVRRLTSFGFNPAWSPDGREILCGTESARDPRSKNRPSRIWRVEVATQKRRLVETGDAMQPSWSPGGRRIAYWGVPAGSSRRVLWTVSVKGGRPVPVSDDGSLNWSPVWAPDGGYLYYASNRSGSMNLWRVPIAEETGRLLGPAEPVSTPASWSGPLSLSQDGRRILYATVDERFTLERTELDPATLEVTRPPEPVVEGSLQLGFAQVSPDGRWVAFNTLLPQEDLFVVRPDGSGLRQLTRDAFKDRGVGWSRDGRILFFSDRSGRYEAWTIRPDGSGLLALTRSAGEAVLFPRGSPDGRWLACGAGAAGPALIDLSLPLARRRLRKLPPPPVAGFFVHSWSPEGRRLAGGGQGIFSFSLETRRYERLTRSGHQPHWLGDGHRLLYLDQGEILVRDLRTRQSRQVLAPAGASGFQSFDVTPEGRFLYTVRVSTEGDLGMLSLQAEED
jgi:serine/threonine protein kinase/Tol biopolymer transport system component